MILGRSRYEERADHLLKNSELNQVIGDKIHCFKIENDGLSFSIVESSYDAPETLAWSRLPQIKSEQKAAAVHFIAWNEAIQSLAQSQTDTENKGKQRLSVMQAVEQSMSKFNELYKRLAK